ncbi:MAG TPA: response regulator transcription factor [Pseudobdellovibrionaceae bacterium]|jgi:DNA-binding response OmpR family regulator
MPKVLVIEDNEEAHFLLQRILATSHEFTIVSSLQSAIEHIEKENWDLIILDRDLPDGDGLSLCLKLKSLALNFQPFILMLTAYSELEDKINGLLAGADDYVVKPFEPRELLARMDALLRRKPSGPDVSSTVSLGDLTINLEKHTMSVKKSLEETISFDLTPIECKVLLTLVKNYGQEIGRDQLRQIVWDKVHLSIRNIDTHICHLRKKIAPSNFLIKNRRGKGYYLIKK